jgi:hypothetical protein
MPRIPFDLQPPSARLWIFSASRQLSDLESQRILAEADAFIDQWAAHGVPLTASRELRHDRFVFVAVDEEAAGVSGCSIDALIRRMRHLGDALGVELVNNAPVVYRDGAAIARESRQRFGELVEAGAITLDTVVFDNTLTTVGDLRAGRWEVRAADAWHRRAFFPPTAVC